VASSAVSQAEIEALSCPNLTLPPFPRWKIATALLGVSEFLVASARAGVAPIGYLRLTRSEYAYANYEQQN
jgi:hypothetical protein